MKFKIYDAEVELDFLDADEMERVEAALNRVQDRNKAAAYEGLKQSEMIRTQCGIIFDFFDEVFGDGTHKRIFGNKCNLIQALKAFEAFNAAKNSSTDEVRELGKKYNANRAQRRAEQRTPNRAPVPYNGHKKKGNRHH